ncbi:MAG: hypothetical protein U0176_02830 [Bacteroidia bacterium]
MELFSMAGIVVAIPAGLLMDKWLDGKITVLAGWLLLLPVGLIQSLGWASPPLLLLLLFALAIAIMTIGNVVCMVSMLKGPGRSVASGVAFFGVAINFGLFNGSMVTGYLVPSGLGAFSWDIFLGIALIASLIWGLGSLYGLPMGGSEQSIRWGRQLLAFLGLLAGTGLICAALSGIDEGLPPGAEEWANTFLLILLLVIGIVWWLRPDPANWRRNLAILLPMLLVRIGFESIYKLPVELNLWGLTLNELEIGRVRVLVMAAFLLYYGFWLRRDRRKTERRSTPTFEKQLLLGGGFAMALTMVSLDGAKDPFSAMWAIIFYAVAEALLTPASISLLSRIGDDRRQASGLALLMYATGIGKLIMVVILKDKRRIIANDGELGIYWLEWILALVVLLASAFLWFRLSALRGELAKEAPHGPEDNEGELPNEK